MSTPVEHDLFSIWINDYISTGYTPQYVNSVLHDNWVRATQVIQWWSRHSTQAQYRPPDKYTAHFKFYISCCRVGYKHSPPAQLHIQFGLTPSLKLMIITY